MTLHEALQHLARRDNGTWTQTQRRALGLVEQACELAAAQLAYTAPPPEPTRPAIGYDPTVTTISGCVPSRARQRRVRDAAQARLRKNLR